VTAFVNGGRDSIQADRPDQTFQDKNPLITRRQRQKGKKDKKIKDKKTEGGRQTKTEDKDRRQEGQ
jgi:hypothetical protein